MSSDQVYAALKRKFKALHFEPGTPVVIGQLSETLSVSHIPVREALAKLAGEGHVEHHIGKGYFVRRIDPQVILECYTCLEVTLLRSIQLMSMVSDPVHGSRAAAGVELLAHNIENADGPDEAAKNVELILASILGWLDNRYLVRAGLSAIDQIYFIIEALSRKPEFLDVVRRSALHTAKSLKAQKLFRAEAIMLRSFKYGKDNISDHIKDGLHFAKQRQQSVCMT